MAMALPSFLVLAAFIVLPVALNIGYCFTDYDGVRSNYNFVGLDNFINVIKEESFLQIVLNTFKLAILYVVGLNVLAVVIAVFVTNVGRRFGNFVKSLLFFPSLLSMVVVGFIWKLLYDYNNGLINQIMRTLGLEVLVQEWLGNKDLVLVSVSISIIWFALGYYLIIYYAGLMGIPQELYEASDVEGASGLQKFFRITLPMLAPSTTINVVLSTVAILSCFDLPYVLTSGGGPGYFGETIAMEIFRYTYAAMEQGKAFALSVLLALIAVIVAVVELKLLLKREEEY